MAYMESVRGNDYFTRLEVDDEDGNEFTDRWNTGELLCLASAVQRSGDKNWVSVSRAIKPFGEPKRPSDWYTPKNCALQYSKLLKGVEDFKKKSLPRTERETSEELLVKNLTDKRLMELTLLNQQTRAVANSLKLYMEMIENGEYDEHLDELLKQIEEQEKHEEEDFKEWIARRESLNASKRLNKCRVPLTTKGKAPSKILESKRKNSPNPDQIEDGTSQQITDIVLKTEVDADEEMPLSVKPIHIKTEIDASPSLNAILDNKVTTLSSLPSTAAPTSPLLTSLLRNPGTAASNPGSAIVSSIGSSPLKESDILETLERSKISGNLSEIENVGSITKSRESSPRSSVPQSPRPTPASSPLLNSLLKSPSTVSNLTSIQVSPAKESSPLKVVSSPQSFFNPTSALATAAAQQLAVATATLPQSLHFFQQQDLSENRKSSLQSPVNSACLSAPTLSKLLEMPPSTPGRLPPLPVLDTPISSASSIATAESAVVQPLQTSTNVKLQSETELSDATSPSKKIIEKIKTELSSVSESVAMDKSAPVIPPIDKKTVLMTEINAKSTSMEQKVSFKHGLMEMDDTSQENIDILEAVCESINQAFEKKEAKLEAADENQHSVGSITNKDCHHSTSLSSKHIILKTDKSEEMLTSVKDSEILACSPDEKIDDKVFDSTDLKDISELLLFEDDELKKIDMEPEAVSDVASISSDPGSKVTDIVDEDHGVSSRKFYKSRLTAKKRVSTEDDLLEKVVENAVNHHSKQMPKKIIRTGKTPESESHTQSFINEASVAMASKDSEESSTDKIQDMKLNVKASEIKSPVSKKPRIFEKTSSKEKKELSEDEIPLARRSGRKAKKGRRIFTKSVPVKQEEPKDQYEFSESTEENSVGYQTTNTLCYMPRLKEDIKFEDMKNKQISQNTGDALHTSSHAVSSSVEKKYFNTPLRTKQARSVPQPSCQKNLFASDEERMSDSFTSDDASNPQFGEDKLKKWKTSSEKNIDASKEPDDSIKSTQRPLKATDSPRKKFQQTKRSPFKSESSTRKEKKIVGSDIEEFSTCSRDSEDAISGATWQREDIGEEKDQNADPSVDAEAETNDSRLSSSVTAESDRQMDDVEGYESLQGSITTEFSPLPSSEIKDEKDMTHFEKQDWYHGSSPKSSEPVSQSSEESEEYESDNWDNQSVSTNKSASHSAGQQPRLKRKERESPQYKAWKKAISIVLREASCHKYANVFLQKVTNDVAPGYLSIVNRPMDLSLIKKNIDNGIVKTTSEFHRDMMLMFQNAIMYNSSDHDVHHMAVEMQRDVIQQIQAFLTTQTNDKDETVEPTSSLRGARTAKSQKVYSSATKSRDETERE